MLNNHYHVLEADSSDKVLETLSKSNIDLIILDNEIQGTSSFTFCKVLKESSSWKDIPIILVSPDVSASARVEGLNNGADDYLSESCFDPELLARVKSSLKFRNAELMIAEQSRLLEAYDRRSEQEAERLSEEESTEKQNHIRLNQQLNLLRWNAEVLREQDRLLHRISNTIRRSFEIRDNLTEMLGELAGLFNLDACFLVLPSEDNPDDSIRCEYASDPAYSAKAFDIDLKTYDIFKAKFQSDQCLIVNDVASENRLDPFRQETLTRQHVISLFYIPILDKEQLFGLLVGFKCELEAEWNSDNEVFLKSVADQVVTGVINARLYARVQRQATTDGLTGLLNHRTGQEKLSEQVRLAERYQRNIAVIMIDVDHFKAINDTYGHPAGDTVLKAVAKSIERDCRDVDFPVRYGGEEFLLVLPEINLEGAVTVAERIRKNLEQAVIGHENISISVTASMGVAIFPDDARSQQQLLDLADKALYASKRSGRNQVQSASDLVYDEIASKDRPTSKDKIQAAPTDKVNASSPAVSKQTAVEIEVAPPVTPASPIKEYDTSQVSGPPPKSAASSSAAISAPALNEVAYPSANAATSSVSDLPATSPELLSFQATPAAAPLSEPYSEMGEEKDELVPEVVEMVKALATTLYSQSEYNKIHHLETARLSELLAKMMGLPQQRVEQVRVASLLHDVGTLSISPDLLNKTEPYTNEERQVINQHPVLGAELLRPIRALREICDILEHHHERWDGTGFPRGLQGENIPLPARIISLVDSYHAMISDRPYRDAMSEAQAINTLKEGAGAQWDPFLVDIFITILTNNVQNQSSSQNQQSTSTSSS
jgi:diguanylate cyclase (GGDEF)-like protein/putative nucleotidyltransferase with HDIG domain